MQNSLSPSRLHFPRGLRIGVCDMVMIATHDCASEWSAVKSRLRHCGQPEQSNPIDYHAMEGLKKLFVFLLSPCFPVLENAEKPTTTVLDLSQNEKPDTFERGRGLDREQKITDVEHEWRWDPVFCLSEDVWRGRKVDSCPSCVYSKEDMFEVTAMERQGSAPDPGAKWIQMSEHVHKVESTCTVVVFPCSKVQSLLFIPFFLAVAHSLFPFFLFRVLSQCHSLGKYKYDFLTSTECLKGFNDPVRNPLKYVHPVMAPLRSIRQNFFLRKIDFLVVQSRLVYLPPHPPAPRLTESKIKPWYFWAW